MNKKQHDNIQFTAADIQRYLQGQMTSADMYALEKAALEDPFLADAIEGYAERTGAGESNLKTHLDDLHHRLNKRIEGEADKKIIPINKPGWWRIAAVLILLAGSGALVYTLVNNSMESRKSTVAKNDSATADTSSGTTLFEQPLRSADSTSVALNDKSPVKEPDAFSLSKAKPRSNASANAPVLMKQAAPQAVDRAPEQSDRSLENNSEKNIAASSSREKKINIPAPVENSSAMRAYSKEAPAGYFSGKVITKDDQPVAGASVQISGRNEGVATDSNGNFTFTLPDTIAAVAVNAVGFEPTRTTIRNNSNSSITLKENISALNDVVVTGYGSQKKSRILLAQPAIGFAEYNKYIDKNKRIDSTESRLHGNVVISFFVNRNGKLSDFKIEKSVSKPFDEEAIRLLKEGPVWKTMNKKKTRVNFTIEF